MKNTILYTVFCVFTLLKATSFRNIITSIKHMAYTYNIFQNTTHIYLKVLKILKVFKKCEDLEDFILI